MRTPRSGSLTQELADAIEQELSDFEKALYSFDYDSETYGYRTWIDTGSFVDYFIINEFTCNYDAGNLSTYLYKDIGGKYRMCIWDFNSACDNYTSLTTQPQHFEMQNGVWYYMLTKNEDFVRQIIQPLSRAAGKLAERRDPERIHRQNRCVPRRRRQPQFRGLGIYV